MVRRISTTDGLVPLVMDNTVAQSVRATVPIQKTVIRVNVVHVVHETFTERRQQHSSEIECVITYRMAWLIQSSPAS